MCIFDTISFVKSKVKFIKVTLYLFMGCIMMCCSEPFLDIDNIPMVI